MQQEQQEKKLLRLEKGAPVCLLRNVRAGHHSPKLPLIELQHDHEFVARCDEVVSMRTQAVDEHTLFTHDQDTFFTHEFMRTLQSCRRNCWRAAKDSEKR